MERYKAHTDGRGFFVLDMLRNEECYKTRSKTEGDAQAEADALNRLYAGWRTAARKIAAVTTTPLRHCPALAALAVA